MIQGRLWLLQIVRTEPPPFNTADCKLIGVGDDGLPYILKRTADGVHVPVSEYLCTQLAAAIGLAVPACAIAVLPGPAQELCFASREEAGVMPSQQVVSMLLQPTRVAHFTDRLMQWYAFDLFVHNIDRHLGNFLIRDSMIGAVLMGMDFSRALLTQGWPAQAPPLPECNTTLIQHVLSARSPYPSIEAAHITARLAAVPDEWLNEYLQRVPAAWLTATLRARLTRWWHHGRSRRLRLLRRHLTSGRYLRIFAHPRSA